VAAALTALRKLSLGLLLIAGAAAILLWSDLGSRNRDVANASPGTAVFKVALVQYASQAGIDEAMRGVIEALKARGYEDGGRLAVRTYNAEADIATANAIGREVVSGGNDLIVSVTTASLQTIANANRNGTKTRHVFGLVTDPYGAGVGISRDNHMEHPPYMTGYGSMQPVADGFRMARTMRPELKTVGLVWNPAESNSVAQTKVAREVCAALGITLIEANAENSTSAAESASSLISRGVEAIWISGDVTALIASDAIIGIARRARIPVFTSIPPNADKGALFDFGSDFVEIGHAIGNLAADVLEGRNPADVPVENLVPPMFIINKTALAGLKNRWTIPDAILEKANVVIDETGRHVKAKETAAAPAASTAPVPRKMITRDGFMAGLAKADEVIR
jgi:ABC-type uncharacterized transport system substrate-binding protein